jgi:Leucine-rich repeat (LRR) protein
MLLNLKVLTLNDNRIKTISFNHDLPNLRELNLRKNKISSIIFDR